jgi:hypothetical protein
VKSRRKWEANIKICLREIGRGCGLNLCARGGRSVACCSEPDNEPSVYVKCWEVLNYLSGGWVPKKSFAPLSFFVCICHWLPPLVAPHQMRDKEQKPELWGDTGIVSVNMLSAYYSLMAHSLVIRDICTRLTQKLRLLLRFSCPCMCMSCLYCLCFR